MLCRRCGDNRCVASQRGQKASSYGRGTSRGGHFLSDEDREKSARYRNFIRSCSVFGLLVLRRTECGGHSLPPGFSFVWHKCRLPRLRSFATDWSPAWERRVDGISETALSHPGGLVWTFGGVLAEDLNFGFEAAT